MKTRIALSCLALSFGTAVFLMAQTSTQFAKANQEYAAGDFKAAIGDYEELVRSGQDTPNVFYNLGNAYFRKNDFGHAILNYERALALEPHHPEAQANLRIARDEARALELIPSRWERLFTFASENQYAITAAVAFWIALFPIAAFTFGRRRSGGAIALSVLSSSIFVITMVATYQLSHGKNGRGLAVVTGDKVEARLATADNANRVLTLPAGSEVQVVSQRGDWIYAALPNNLHGWIPANGAEQVRF